MWTKDVKVRFQLLATASARRPCQLSKVAPVVWENIPLSTTEYDTLTPYNVAMTYAVLIHNSRTDPQKYPVYVHKTGFDTRTDAWEYALRCVEELWPDSVALTKMRDARAMEEKGGHKNTTCVDYSVSKVPYDSGSDSIGVTISDSPAIADAKKYQPALYEI